MDSQHLHADRWQTVEQLDKACAFLDHVVAREIWQALLRWIYKHTIFLVKEDVENIAAYTIELAWKDWNPLFNVPFEKFIWTKKGKAHLYLQKGIQKQLTDHGMIRRKWYTEETATWIDKDGKEHGIEDFADPQNFGSQLFSAPKNESYYELLDATEITAWVINEINRYIVNLLDMCDYNKLLALQALCLKGMSLTEAASKKGLVHANMNPVVIQVRDDLARRMGIPQSRIKHALNLIRREITLSSQLYHFGDLE